MTCSVATGLMVDPVRSIQRPTIEPEATSMRKGEPEKDRVTYLARWLQALMPDKRLFYQNIQLNSCSTPSITMADVRDSCCLQGVQATT